MNPTQSIWSDEDAAKLRRLRAKGVPYAEIGQILGRSTKSCVRRAERERQPAPGTVAKRHILHRVVPFKEPEPQPAPAPVAFALPPLSSLESVPVEVGQRQTDRAIECAWPMPERGRFACCGVPTVGRRSYCAVHCAVAYPQWAVRQQARQQAAE